MKNNITTGWKSTITGFIIILASIVYLLDAETVNFYAFGTALVVGVLLLFSPDTLINSIEKFFSKKSSDDLNNE